MFFLEKTVYSSWLDGQTMVAKWVSKLLRISWLVHFQLSSEKLSHLNEKLAEFPQILKVINPAKILLDFASSAMFLIGTFTYVLQRISRSVCSHLQWHFRRVSDIFTNVGVWMAWVTSGAWAGLTKQVQILVHDWMLHCALICWTLLQLPFHPSSWKRACCHCVNITSSFLCICILACSHWSAHSLLCKQLHRFTCCIASGIWTREPVGVNPDHKNVDSCVYTCSSSG